jgi:hypothetical protein
MRAIAGFGDEGECEPKRYANGAWRNFDDLMNAVGGSLEARGGMATPKP